MLAIFDSQSAQVFFKYFVENDAKSILAKFYFKRLCVLRQKQNCKYNIVASEQQWWKQNDDKS